MQINDSKATFTLQTRPSRLVRVKTPPPTSLLPKNQPYPYSSSHPLLKPHGFSQGEVLPPLPYPLNNNKSLEFSTSQKSNTNSFGNGKKKHSQTVVNMSTGTLSTPPSYQPQSTSKKPKIRVEQQQQQQYHQQHQQKYKGKTKAHQPATSKILLTGKSVKKNLYLQDAEKIASKVPKAATGKRKVIGNFDADNPGIYSTHDNGSKNLIPKKLEERMPSILTLQEQEPEEYDFTKGDSDIDDVRNELDEAEGEEEEDSEFEDDEEEQEISDFDSLGECEDEEDGSMGGETLDDDEETKTGCSRSASSYGSDDTSSGLKNWKTTPTQANHNLTQRNAIKTKNFSSSAQKYGIAVMIDDDTENQFSANGETVVKSGHKIKSAIVPSLFDDGEAVLYFPREGESACLRKAGFKLVKGGKKWIGYWGKHYAAEKFRTIEPWQKVNHFPMSFEIGRKDKMYLNVSRMRERVRDEVRLDFLPATYFLPNQRRRLKLAFGTHPCWIIKPPASARGIGIRVVNRWKDIPQRKDIIVSKYVQNPYLIDKKKFDIRLYVVVTSFDPLRIYLFKEGIVRFAGEKSLALLDKYFSRQGINFAPVMERIKHIIVSTVISTHAANSSGTRMYTTNTSSCYELFGFDVLLDAHLKPWIMEVNISPSLKASCDIDLAIKSRLSIDLFNLVGIKVKDLDESQKSHKKRKAQKPFLSSSERAKLRQFASSNGDLNLLVDLTNNDLKILKESEDEQAISSQQQQTQPLTQKSNARQIQSHAREFGSYTSSHSDVTAAAGLNKYPERQQIDVKKAILTASSAGIAPRVNPTYTLKPRKIFVRKPEDGLGIFGNGNSSELLLQSQLQPPPQPSQQPAPPPSVVINELASIVKEMQQIQCQRQMQQQTRRAAIPSSCGLNKEYPSTSAYTAAMAIAHVTAKFRALEMNEQDRKFQHDLPTWNNILKDIG
ncbi:Tubulin polyglutamylase ttll4 [Physocladia obscura]|uniref:Tubulin polyglutamylase ttll4 n=1 Tax=Physocladia obscura TaxID=109957 RepID=A0AAD5X7I6_9FUNG|nr:Tubulin polyglutamylase ttll4 [Physocladia obscura]